MIAEYGKIKIMIIWSLWVWLNQSKNLIMICNHNHDFTIEFSWLIQSYSCLYSSNERKFQCSTEKVFRMAFQTEFFSLQYIVTCRSSLQWMIYYLYPFAILWHQTNMIINDDKLTIWDNKFNRNIFINLIEV